MMRFVRHCVSKKSLKSLKQGLFYASLIMLPPMLPFFLFFFFDIDHAPPRSNMRVEVARDALEKDFNQFKPRKVFLIGMYLHNLSDIQVWERTFQSQLTYWAKNYFDKSKNDRSELGMDSFQIVNENDLEIEGLAKRFVGKEEKESPFVSYVSYEAGGSLKNDFYLSAYPFDTHKLEIIVEPANATAEEMLLSIDPNSSIGSNISLGEWKIKSFQAKSEIFTTKSDFSDPALIGRGSLWTYVPRVTFEIEIERHIFSNLIKVLLPLLIILTMAYMNLFIDPASYEVKAEVCVTAFLSIAALHWVAAGEQTGVSYLTAMDQFFLVSYALILLLTMESVLSNAMSSAIEQETNRTLRPHPWFVMGIPIIRILYPLILIGGWYWIAFQAVMK